VPLLAGTSYQTLRSVSDHHVFVVCHDGRFYDTVPEEVRKQGPWQGMHRGEIDKLNAEYRLALARRLCTREVRARGVQAGSVMEPHRICFTPSQSSPNSPSASSRPKMPMAVMRSSHETVPRTAATASRSIAWGLLRR
jgi:hypothetical protein